MSSVSRQASASSTDSSVATPASRGVGATVILASIAAIVVIFAVVTIGIGIVVESFAVGAVLGAFCAVWAGIGFGVMASGAIAVLPGE